MLTTFMYLYVLLLFYFPTPVQAFLSLIYSAKRLGPDKWAFRSWAEASWARAQQRVLGNRGMFIMNLEFRVVRQVIIRKHMASWQPFKL